MRRIAITLFLVCLTGAAVLMTMGLMAPQPIYYVLALWLFVLSLVILLGLIIRIYQRVMNRTRTTNELLSEIRFLQERRYEQLARRLDSLSGIAGAVPLGASNHRVSGTSATSRVVEHAELEDLNARLQRTERRILGKLENEMLRSDERIRQLAEALAAFQNDQKNTPG